MWPSSLRVSVLFWLYFGFILALFWFCIDGMTGPIKNVNWYQSFGLDFVLLVLWRLGADWLSTANSLLCRSLGFLRDSLGLTWIWIRVFSAFSVIYHRFWVTLIDFFKMEFVIFFEVLWDLIGFSVVLGSFLTNSVSLQSLSDKISWDSLKFSRIL